MKCLFKYFGRFRSGCVCLRFVGDILPMSLHHVSHSSVNPNPVTQNSIRSSSEAEREAAVKVWVGAAVFWAPAGMICFRARGCRQHPVPCGLSVRGPQLLVDCCLEAALTSLPRGLPQHDNSFPRAGEGGCLLTGLWTIITHIPSPLPYFVGYR